ncbi:uncharacterized protein M421DRAFT_6313 [Didymella exigua CBS 183.55]|uniref:Uncharacterized protein n=1 Tax=Didymella exigua CBS 183.55 TaxID=1150837 RepID=A0A6A5RFN7_9PLEO|nr:uncharacterized protein M421DRAFT_6313 [Didymella exigua CBS 183.55]KAF1927111.1 hypothetical protein M421DRAFT_6313 [Didymella exigua CBS 183.55]
MAPKKVAPPPNTTIEGYDVKETRILAAAFVSSLGADKYNWPLFATLTGFTEGSLKKFWPPVKNKALEQHESFGTFLKGGAAPAKAAGGKKRKAANADADADLDPKISSADAINGKAPEAKSKKAPSKKRGKKAKTEEDDEEKVKVGDDSVDGGDGLGEFVYKKHVLDWSESTDGTAEEA